MTSRILPLAAPLLVLSTTACTTGNDAGAPDVTGGASGGARGGAGGGGGASSGPSEQADGGPLVLDERARLGWEPRVPLGGARLEAGDSYNLLVRALRRTGRGVQGFGAVEIAYETDGEEHAVRDDTSVEFRQGC